VGVRDDSRGPHSSPQCPPVPFPSHSVSLSNHTPKPRSVSATSDPCLDATPNLQLPCPACLGETFPRSTLVPYRPNRDFPPFNCCALPTWPGHSPCFLASGWAALSFCNASIPPSPYPKWAALPVPNTSIPLLQVSGTPFLGAFIHPSPHLPFNHVGGAPISERPHVPPFRHRRLAALPFRAPSLILSCTTNMRPPFPFPLTAGWRRCLFGRLQLFQIPPKICALIPPSPLPQVGGAPFSGAFKAIADTGTSLLALPKADLATLIARLPGVKELPGTGEYIVPDCTKVGRPFSPFSPAGLFPLLPLLP
jgi:hypothetical protein